LVSSSRGTFAAFLGEVGPEFRPLCFELRDMIEELHPGFVETVWTGQWIASYGVGPKKMTEHYAFIHGQPGHVNLGFYHGSLLPDPEGVLEGGGKLLRHIKLRGESDAKKPAVRALLIAAIEDRMNPGEVEPPKKAKRGDDDDDDDEGVDLDDDSGMGPDDVAGMDPDGDEDGPELVQ